MMENMESDEIIEPSSLQQQCYCGGDVEPNNEMLTCSKCSLLFHLACLKNGRPSELLGDIFFDFTCCNCSPNGLEECQRIKLQWIHVVSLALYNLQFTGTGKMGYYRWKDHICAFIDKHWKFLFGSRKKTNLWHGTVAGILSTGCPNYFTSGSKEIGESGWWKLAAGKISFMNLEASWKSFRKRTKAPPVDVTLLPAGLRSRQKKSSLEVAIERKEKRLSFTEPKTGSNCQISGQKSSTSRSGHGSSKNADKTIPAETDTTTPHSPTPTTSAVVTNDSFEFGINNNYNISSTSNNFFLPSSLSTSPLSFFSHRPTDIKQEPSFSHRAFDVNNVGELGNFMEQDEEPSPEKTVKPESVETSTTVSLPSFLKDDSDSDIEIDIGTFSPIPARSPSPTSPRLSPSLQEMFAVLDGKTDEQFFPRMPTSLLDLSLSENAGKAANNNNSSNSFEDSNENSIIQVLSNPSTPSGKQPKKKPVTICDKDEKKESLQSKPEPGDEEDMMVDSIEMILDANEKEPEENDKDDDDENEKDEADDEEEEAREEQELVEEVTVTKYLPISLYHEKKLLERLNFIAKESSLPPDLHRFRRKLIVRQIKRERGLPLFDLDAEVNRHLGLLNPPIEAKDWNQMFGVPTSYCHPADVRVLSRFLTHSESMPPKPDKQQPLFINRLIGMDDEQLQCICSPYTTRWLKPFIRRDYETKTLKMRLLEEIIAYPHRNNPNWVPPTSHPIDYCYVRPQHIPSVNSLCQQFFWPGIDLSECLQYPDFSCVVLYRKIVIGFAFMVPDIKYNEAYISFLFTHPEWCRSGIATFVLYHLIQTCMGKDVTLHVSANNPAMLLYQKFGFKPEQFILDFYDKYYPSESTECKHAFFLRLRR